MSTHESSATTRREFVKQSGRVAAAGSLLSMALPRVHAGEDNTIRIALVGCGGRGTGAAANALSTKTGPIKLVAMADVFPNKLATEPQESAREVRRPDGRRAGRSASSSVSTATARRWTACGPATSRFSPLRPPSAGSISATRSRRASTSSWKSRSRSTAPARARCWSWPRPRSAKNLKVGVGLMCRHCQAREELHDRIKSGEIGDILLLRAYRMQGPIGSAFVDPPAGDMSELLYQIKNFHGFLWASGGCYSDFLIHNIDECCWMKDAWPVKAKAAADATIAATRSIRTSTTTQSNTRSPTAPSWILNGRNIPGCHNEFASYAHGTKGSAVISTASHTPAKCRIV